MPQPWLDHAYGEGDGTSLPDCIISYETPSKWTGGEIALLGSMK